MELNFWDKINKKLKINGREIESEEESEIEIENEIKEESEKDNIKELIKREIKKNKKILEYLMINKFRHLSYFIEKTYEALKYLENNNIRYTILNNRLENFYKEKNEKMKEIKFETNFKLKIKILINKLIENKDEITFKIKEFGKSIKEYIYKEKFFLVIIQCYSIN